MTERITTPCQCTPTCQPQTEWVDGLEFVVSTWCNTPQPWNQIGHWLDVPAEIETRVKAGMRKACDVNALLLILDETNEPLGGGCETYWGSHGCGLNKNHGGLWHICGYIAREDPDDPTTDYGWDMCMAVMEWGQKSLIPWSDEGEGDEWDWRPWGLRSRRY